MSLDRAALATALAAFALALPVAFIGQPFMDETTLLSHALRLGAGQVMYRDFFEFIAPAAAWLPALLFTLLPPSLLLLRVVTAAALGLAAWQLHRLARGLGLPPGLAALPGLLLAGALYATVPGYSHHWLIQPLVFGALLAAGQGREAPGMRPWLLAGAATGLAVLTVQSDGVVLAAALGAWLALDAWTGGMPWQRAATHAAWLAAGAALPLGLAVAYWLATHALGAALADMWAWPLTHYKGRGGLNDVKYLTDLPALLSTTAPGFRLWAWYLGAYFYAYAYALPVGLGALLLAYAAGRRGPWDAATARLALMAVAGCALFAALVKGRADHVHALCYLPAWLLLGATLAWRWQARFAGPGLALVRWLPAASLAAFGLAGAALAAHAVATQPELRPLAGGPDAHLRQDPAVSYLRAHARPGDRLAVFPLGQQLYAYALPPATSYTSMLDPAEGYYDRAQYEDFWAQVRAARPRFLVLGPLARSGPVPALPVAGYRFQTSLEILYVGVPSRALIFERE